MLIECTLKRDQAIEVPMGSETYVFQPDAKGRRVAEVYADSHIRCFLAIPHLYREVKDGADAEQSQAPDPNGIIRIKGIGSRLAEILGALDPPVTTLEQIAAWEPDDVARVEAHLKFPDRITREHWVQQAKDLIAPPAAPPAAETSAEPAA